ncbi:hypothetical protein ES705_51036 [subsurface metagenome]
MNNNFIKNLSDSTYDTKRLVLPKIKELGWLKGKFTQIEITTDKDFKKLAHDFDSLSGIDIWQVENKKGITGIANRVQWTDENWASFTIRAKIKSGHDTEYQKRIKALKSNGKYIYPYITIQSYIEKPRRQGKLISMGMGFTEDIIKMIDEGKYEIRINPTDETEFYIVFWKAMKECSFKVIIWINDEKIKKDRMIKRGQLSLF